MPLPEVFTLCLVMPGPQPDGAPSPAEPLYKGAAATHGHRPHAAMPKRAGSHLARPRHARSRAHAPLVQRSAPDLHDCLWQILADLLARSGCLYHCLQLTMVCRSARASIAGDERLWLSILRQLEREYWTAAATRGSYGANPHRYFHFTNLSAPPDFMRPRSTNIVAGARRLPIHLFHTLPEADIPADQ